MNQIAPRPRHILCRAALPLVAVTVLLLPAACAKGGDTAATTEIPAVVGAQTAMATMGPFAETVGAIGTVEPRAGFRAVLSAPAPTRVSGIAVSAGQRVTKGQLLVELDRTTIDADAQSAEAAELAAQQGYDRAQRMVTAGIAARRELEQAAAALAQTKSAVASARRTAQLSTLRAPFDGVVTQLDATLGASVDPSQPLVAIANPSVVDIVIALSASDAARVHPGAKVLLRSAAGTSGDSLGEATVVDVAGIVDPVSHSVAVRAHAGHTVRELRIGEMLYGEIVLALRPHAITIPAEALVPEGDGYKVFVVDSSGLAIARAVAVGGRHAGVAEITSGLTAGERVVTYGAYGVTDSARIIRPGAKSAADSTPTGAQL